MQHTNRKTYLMRSFHRLSFSSSLDASGKSTNSGKDGDGDRLSVGELGRAGRDDAAFGLGDVVAEM